MIDWAATGTMLTGIGTIASALAIGGAALVGNRKANDFREQRQTERELEFAERALAVAYQLESALDSIRSPMSTGGELERSKAELQELDWFNSEDDAAQKRWTQANVFLQRMRHFDKEFEEASTLQPFVRAYFGREAEQALEQLLHARHLVRINAEEYAIDNGGDSDFTKDIRSHIWRSYSPRRPDPIREMTEAAVKKLEGQLAPLIRKDIRAEHSRTMTPAGND